MSRRTLSRSAALIAVCLLAGCYQSHPSVGGPSARDAGRRDAGAPSRLDASASQDAGRRPDAGPPPDAFVPPSTCEFTLQDRRPLDVPPDNGCGQHREPRVVATEPGSLRFLTTENRFCDDRFAEVRSQVMMASDVLRPMPSIFIGAATAPNSEAAYQDGIFAWVNGLRMVTMDMNLLRLEAQIEPDPPSRPGCPMVRSASAIAPFGDGTWMVGWNIFECDVFGFEAGHYGPDFARIGELFHGYNRPQSIAELDNGVGWASSLETPHVWLWGRGQDAPRESILDAPGGVTQLVHWPFADGYAAAVVARSVDAGTEIDVFVLNESGAVVARYTHDAFLGPHDFFSGARIDVAAADFGLVIGATVFWEGGAVRSIASVFGVGASGERLGAGLIEESEEPLGPGDIAGNGPHAVVTRGSGVSREQPLEALLFTCD